MNTSVNVTRAPVLALVAMLAICAAAQAQEADLNGVWSNGTAPIRISQNGNAVSFRYITSDFDHRFSGQFVAPTTIEGQYAPRRNRTTGCTTRMNVHIRVTGGDSFVLRWRALDSIATSLPAKRASMRPTPGSSRSCGVVQQDGFGRLLAGPSKMPLSKDRVIRFPIGWAPKL